MRIVLSFLLVLSLCGCKSETKEEKAPEEKPIITEETKATDAAVKDEVESICSALKKCLPDEACDSRAALKALALKSPYATGLRERLISSDLAKKSLDELTMNARGLGAECELKK